MIFYFLTEKTRVTSPGERRIFKLSRYIMSKNFQKVLGFEIISIFFFKNFVLVVHGGGTKGGTLTMYHHFLKKSSKIKGFGILVVHGGTWGWYMT